MIRRIFRFFFPRWIKHLVVFKLCDGKSSWEIREYWFRNDKPWPRVNAWVLKSDTKSDAEEGIGILTRQDEIFEWVRFTIQESLK